MFPTIVVATDGSRFGDQVMAKAKSLIDEETKHVFVVHVVELVGGKGGRFPAAADEDEIRIKISEQADDLRAAGHQVDLVIEVSDVLRGPSTIIAEVALAASADLIVVGSHGHSGMVNAVLGSVTSRLLHHAHCPVLVVPTR